MNKIYHEICFDYLNKVCESVSTYETLETTFPLGVLNEIRNLFTHLAKSEISEDSNEKNKEMENAQKHLKRAIRDSYKYNCLAYEKLYSNLKKEKLYENEAFHIILRQIETSHDKAVAEVIEARSYERKVKAEIVGDEFEHYEKAFAEFETMKKLIDALHAGQQN